MAIVVMPSSTSARLRATPESVPKTTPVTAPSRDIRTDSRRTTVRTWRRVPPTARRSPSSRVRSTTESTSVFTMPSTATTTARSNSAVTMPSSWLTELWAFSVISSGVLTVTLG